MAPASKKAGKKKGKGAKRRRRSEREPLYRLLAYTTLQGVLAKNVRSLRQEQGLTQEAAAARVDLTLQVWQRVEHGKTNASLLTIARISQALGVKAADLLG